MNWDEFTSIPNGTRILNHGFDQCVALANLYHESVIGGGFVPVNSAYQWWTEFNRFPQLTSKYTQSASSAPGAIFVAKGGPYDAVHGHIGVVTADNDIRIATMEQNAGAWRYVGRYKRDMNGILGFLIPKVNPAIPTPPTPVPPAPEPEKKRKKLKMDNVCVALSKDGIINVKIFCMQTGDEHTFVCDARTDAPYVANVAKTYGCTMVSYITESHFQKIGGELKATRDRIEKMGK